MVGGTDMKLACVSKRVAMVAAVSSVLIPFSLAQGGSGIREDFDTGIGRTSQLVVMLTSQIGAAATFGAGIVFGRDHDRLYIVTANHVVRRGTIEATNIRVTLKSIPEKSFVARLLGQSDRESDVAVVALESWARQGVDGCRLLFDRLGDPGTLQRGNTVYAIGNPNGENWRLPLSERLYDARADQLAFESAFIAVGSSGGALLDPYTRIVGMVRREEPPTGSAVPISVVLPLVSKWGYPVQLRVARPDGSTPLHAAAVSGDIDRIRAELAAACADPNVRDSGGNTPLHRAAAAGQLEAVRALIQGGANVRDSRSRGQITALHHAATRHDQQIAAVLLNVGADTNARDNLGSTPLVYVKPGKTDTPKTAQAKAEFVRFLISAGADVNAKPTSGDGLLHEALKAENQEILTALLEAHADVNLRGWGDSRPLELAAKRGDMGTVKLLLRAGADAKAGDAYRNALSIALMRKNGPLVALLLNSGASLSTVGSIDVLQEAIREGWSDVVKLVLQTGADVNLLRNSQNVDVSGIAGSSDKLIPLGIAVEARKPEMVALLIANKANVNLGDHEGQTPLHLAACAEGDVLVKVLLGLGARVNARDVWRGTPLHKAVSCRNEPAAKFLIQSGAPVNAEDNAHNTPLSMAKGTSLEPLLRPRSGR